MFYLCCPTVFSRIQHCFKGTRLFNTLSFLLIKNIGIGSDKFETSGVIMAMVPGTVKDLEHIVDLKDAKDTWKDAGDQLYDSSCFQQCRRRQS